MTPLQELLGSIWGLLPGLIPHLFVAWVATVAAAGIRLAIDEYRGECRSMLSELPFALWTGGMLTLFVVLSAAHDQGLIAQDSLAGMLVGSLAVTIPLVRGKWRRAA